MEPVCMAAHILVARDYRQSTDIVGIGRARQPLLLGRGRKTALQGLDRGKVKRRIAPLQHLDAVEAVALYGFDQFWLEAVAASRRTESAVSDMAPGATGDLAEFRGRQAAKLVAVEFAVASKGDM